MKKELTEKEELRRQRIKRYKAMYYRQHKAEHIANVKRWREEHAAEYKEYQRNYWKTYKRKTTKREQDDDKL